MVADSEGSVRIEQVLLSMHGHLAIDRADLDVSCHVLGASVSASDQMVLGRWLCRADEPQIEGYGLRVVRFQDYADGDERLDDLVSKRADDRRVRVREQPPTRADVVLRFAY
ncbi:hypothetical protein IU505_29660 [Nocardia nova]|nr:hypothetical protein [Nocardia nova]